MTNYSIKMISSAMTSLRGRMLLGSGLIALLAVAAAVGMIYAGIVVSKRIADAAAAEQRIEILSTLSARINDYAVVAIELANAPQMPQSQRLGRLSSRRELVATEFERLNKAIANYVEEAGTEIEANRRASNSLGAARMRARFDALTKRLEQGPEAASVSTLRVELDGFATQFSPLLDFAIGQERRTRQEALAAIDRLRDRLRWFALAIAVSALLAFALFQFGLISPLLRRIEDTGKAARMIGGGRLHTRLAVDRRDELGLLFANVNRMAARLDRRRRSVEADQSRLNEIIEERTHELREVNAELESIDANRRRFFSDVSHELRTPLTVILGEAALALRGENVDHEQARAAFSVIRERARRLNRRIEDLLRIARSEGGQIKLNDRPFDLRDALANAAIDVEGVARRKGVSLQIEADESALSLGDLDWTRQVICGLIENAVRHSEQGAKIRARSFPLYEEAVIEIIDEGDGVAKDEQERVFERFERGSRGQDQLGFGVGLALARWVIEHQAGIVELTSPAPVALSSPKRGPGTQIVIKLPLLIEEES